MKLYKSPTDQIYAYEPDGSQDHLIPEDYVAVTQAEADAIIAASVVTTAESQRQRRDALLQQSDWTQLPDAPSANRAAWATYRQELRDVTQQSGFPTTVTWPTQP